MLTIHPSVHALADKHAVLDRPLQPPYPEGLVATAFGLGCFWGAEKSFWQQPDVYVTAVGYAGGEMKQPDYRSVCSGQTGHAEVVLVVHEADALASLLTVFWESHDPTQGMRQGNDIGSQYRSAIYLDGKDLLPVVLLSHDNYQPALNNAGYGEITTEIAVGADFWFAEDYHQQYLVKNPAGYCGLGGTGVKATA